MTPFEFLCALRSTPDERAALQAFLVAIDPQIIALTRAFPDPDEAAQRTRIAVRRSWSTCRAETPERLAAWLRRVARTQGIRSIRLSSPPPPAAAEIEPLALPAPDEGASHRALGEAVERSLDAALGIEPCVLSHRHRAWARAHDVASKSETVRRDVEIVIASRRDGVPLDKIAGERGMTLAAAKKAACRGAAAIALAARILAEVEPDPMVREALLEIVDALERER